MTTDLPASSPTLMQRVRALRDARSIASQEIRRGLREVVTPLDICGTVLDVGAGRAPWRDLVPYAERYIAFDVTPLNEVQFVGSVTDLPVRDGAVELAFCTEVLEHVDDTAAALSELNRVLQPGGYLVLTTPLMWGVHDRIDYYRWTAEGLRRILREHGFRMLRLRRRGGIFSTMAALVDQAPFQVLSGSPERFSEMSAGTKVPFLAASALQMALTPAVWGIAALDVLDRDRRFTLGYVTLAKKA